MACRYKFLSFLLTGLILLQGELVQMNAGSCHSGLSGESHRHSSSSAAAAADRHANADLVTGRHGGSMPVPAGAVNEDSMAKIMSATAPAGDEGGQSGKSDGICCHMTGLCSTVVASPAAFTGIAKTRPIPAFSPISIVQQLPQPLVPPPQSV